MQLNAIECTMMLNGSVLLQCLRKKNAVLPMLLTLDTNTPVMNSQQGNLHLENPISSIFITVDLNVFT